MIVNRYYYKENKRAHSRGQNMTENVINMLIFVLSEEKIPKNMGRTTFRI